MKASVILPRMAWRAGEPSLGERDVAEEAAVAIVHDGSTTAVMMATPADLEDFALGFSLSEGIIGGLDDIRSIEVVEAGAGVEARIWLKADVSRRLATRRRQIAGPAGCGLCGVDSIAEAIRPPQHVGLQGVQIPAGTLMEGMARLEQAQTLGRRTRSVHAAALWREGAELIVREDVGRHNALDKLIGGAARAGVRAGADVLLLSSRVSVEMVQKAAVLGAPVLCAVSAPTALAVRTAEAAGITLVAIARADGFEVFTHAGRIV
jgi:FdhD protein